MSTNIDWVSQRSIKEQVDTYEDPRKTMTSTVDATSAAAIMARTGQATGGIQDYFPGGVMGQSITYDPSEGATYLPHVGSLDKPTWVDKRSPSMTTGWIDQASKKKHAYTFLETAVKEMKDRAAQRDVPLDGSKAGAGERSMAATVRAFNALTGKDLTESEGWEFMILLKLVRGRQGDFRADDYVDAAAYSALLGECASTAR